MLKLCSFFFICILAGCGNSVSQPEDTNSQSRSIEQNQQFESANQDQPEADPELTVKMERYSWTHTLLYKVEIQPDGKVVFEEGQVVFVETKPAKPRRKGESKLEKETMRQLLTEIETADFFSLDPAYGYRYKNCQLVMSDTESVKIFIKLNGKEKTIDHDLGCLDMSLEEARKAGNPNDRIFPQQLYKLENKIDEIAETKRWTGEGK